MTTKKQFQFFKQIQNYKTVLVYLDLFRISITKIIIMDGKELHLKNWKQIYAIPVQAWEAHSGLAQKLTINKNPQFLPNNYETRSK